MTRSLTDLREDEDSNRGQQGIGVADLSDHLESRVDQKTRDPFAHEHRIVGEDEPQA